jgi:carotenoid cleavage dioxygenase-like enzyme
MILSFAFKEGKVRFRNKFVRTKGFLDEQVRLKCGGTSW